MATSSDIDSHGKIFAQDKAFWNNYLKGRPAVPKSFFDRIYRYYEEHGGRFGTVHDVGAGNGPYAQELRSKFQHVIISDIVADNVQLAKDRLGTDGFSYRAAKVEEADDIPAGSVDMVFATNVLHFADQKAAIEAVAKQLKPGGTFVAAGFGPALFDDVNLQNVWVRISQEGGRMALKKADKLQERINVMERSSDGYNVAPLDERFFLPGTKRIHLNQEKGGITGLLPPEDYGKKTEPNHTGPNDVEIYENDDGWKFNIDLDGIKEHFSTFPYFNQEPAAFTELWKEVKDILEVKKVVDGVWPATIILATRR